MWFSIGYWHRAFNGRYTAGMPTTSHSSNPERSTAEDPGPEGVDALHYDVIVVGGGMVGAALACALAPTNLRIAILDQRPFDAETAGSGTFDARVSAITPASAHFLSDIGVWDGVLQRRASPYCEMEVWDADGTGSIHFAAADVRADVLGHIVENNVTLAALHERLRAFDQIEWIVPASLEALLSPYTPPDARGASPATEPIRLLLDDQRVLSATLLVAADGGQSRVRELAGFRTREWDYDHHALVTTVRTEKPHRQTAIQRFMDEGVLAFLPLAPSVAEADDQHHCSIVWSVLPDYARELLAQDDATFTRTLQAAIESRLGAIEEVAPRHCFPLRQRHAVSYVQPGIALIGDAAHTIHPLAGQGVNLGLQDAQVLAREISAAVAVGRDFADMRTLRRYQRRRIGQNLGMMWVMEGFKHLFADQPLPVRWLRNAGMSGLDRTPMVKNRIMRSAMGFD